MMQPRLLFLVLFLLGMGSAHVRSAEPPAPADPNLPMPLYSSRLETGLDWVVAVRQALLWHYQDDSITELCWMPCHGGFALDHHWPVFETESYRLSVVGGSGFGIAHEWYLGHGFSALLHVGVRPLGLGGPPLGVRLNLFWYPYEGILISLK